MVFAASALASCGEGAGTSADGGAATTSALRVTAGEGRAVTNNGTYGIPNNFQGASVPLFTRQRDRVSVRNNTGAAITVRGVTVTLGAGMLPEEFTLENTATPAAPLVVSNASVAAGQSFDFYLRFFPVAGGVRTVSLAVDTSAGAFTFTASGRGRPELAHFTRGTIDRERVYGAGNADELAGALAGDAAGNVFFSANASQLVDGINDDLLVGRLNTDGALAWSRVFNGRNRDRAGDSGQNAETGGTSRSLSLGSDGALYAVASTAVDSNNNTFYVLVLKIDAATGNVLWSRAWSPSAMVRTASDSAEGYAIDATGDSVLVTGTTNGNAQVLFLSLNKATGAVVAQRSIEVQAGVNDRGYTIRADGRGGAYIGGITATTGLLLHVAGAQGASPTVDWARRVPISTGGNINDLDVDAAGNVYATLDVRGAQTAVGAASFDAMGNRRWAKTFRSDNSDRFNSHVVRVNGTTVYVGGRMGDGVLDRTQGDGVILALGAADGAYQWGSVHYSGTGSDEICQHRVKGFVFAGNRLVVASQVYTGNQNRTRYAGYWYDLPSTSTADDFDVVPTMTTAMASPVAAGNARDAAMLGAWMPAPAAAVLREPFPSREGSSPDADVLFSWFTLR